MTADEPVEGHDEVCGETRPHYHLEDLDGERLIFTELPPPTGEWFEAFLLLTGPAVVLFVLAGAALGWWSS